MNVKILTDFDFSSICRICLSLDNDLRPLCDDKWLAKVQQFFNIKLEESPKLPTQICRKCVSKLDSFEAFKQTVFEANEACKAYLEQSDILKRAASEAEITAECSEISLSAVIPLEPPPLIPLTPQQKSLNCSVCNEDFASVPLLKCHLSAHSKMDILSCNICRKEFRDRKKLVGHLRGHTVSKAYACKLCSKRYPNPSTFRIHMRTHTGEKPFSCQVCGKRFIRWAGVVGHMRSHTEERPFECQVCLRRFKVASNLERHKILHSDVAPFCCNFCGKTFNQSDNLQLHIRTYHTKERNFLCSECGKGFVSSTRLNRHMWTHAGRKPYACDLCPKSYANLTDLRLHARRCHRQEGDAPEEADKPHGCFVCGRRFSHACRLAKHMKTHQRPFACAQCPRTFSRQAMLCKHVQSKHPEAGDGFGAFMCI